MIAYTYAYNPLWPIKLYIVPSYFNIAFVALCVKSPHAYCFKLKGMPSFIFVFGDSLSIWDILPLDSSKNSAT